MTARAPERPAPDVLAPELGPDHLAPLTDRLDFASSVSTSDRTQPFPGSLRTPPRVLLEPAAYERMQQHASTTRELELCGVLVGDVIVDEYGPYLHITGAIPGEGAENSGAQVTFTQRTWDWVHSEMERGFPRARMVGWYHTHPGFGVFLSRMDQFIHKNFFNLPFAVAVVIDTQRNEEGCFAWVEGELHPLAEYWVGAEKVALTSRTSTAPRNDIAAAVTAPEPEERQEPPRGSWWAELLHNPLLTFAVVFLLGLLCGRLFALVETRRLAEDVRTLETTLVAVADVENLATAREWEAVHDSLVRLEAPPSPQAAAARADLDQLTSALAASYRSPSPSPLTVLSMLAERRTATTPGSRQVAFQLRPEDFGLLAAARIIGLPGPNRDILLTAGQRRAIRLHLDTLLTGAPERADAFERLYPGLLTAVYGPGAVTRGTPRPTSTPAEAR